jgi:hypothetical protein
MHNLHINFFTKKNLIYFFLLYLSFKIKITQYNY